MSWMRFAFLDPLHFLGLVVVEVVLVPFFGEHPLPVVRVLKQVFVLGWLAGHASGVAVRPEGCVVETVK